ncbi:ubiquitin-conjugating enzyme E2-binding protein [Xylaria flabelliformis]|nr:ubiquitin-conjugating enzyme E2-binding protein [Xylaria flabelliformis]
MSPSQRILIYAELLSNIRQVSVGCTLPTSASAVTRATVAADGRTLTVAHDGSNETIQLPESVVPIPQLPIRASGGGTSLSWRLPLAAAPATGRALPTATEESAPWSATDLEPGSTVVCRTCKSTIVDASTLKVWKDLPSENWAEMMEFWHCHKPHGHGRDNDEEEHLTSRGYGASSRIAAQPGIGFVDLTSFLLADSDLARCSIADSAGINNLGDETKATNALHCTSCKTNVGVQNHQDLSSISLFKWQVLVQQQNHASPELPPPSLAQCVSAMLLATMARSGCSKSILLPIKAQPSLEGANQLQDLLNIWVFNANITYSSTEAPTSPTTAIKVFYRTVNQKAADKMLDSITSDVQDISLPSEAITAIFGLLNKSNDFIPQSDRKFQEWTVGLLGK